MFFLLSNKNSWSVYVCLNKSLNNSFHNCGWFSLLYILYSPIKYSNQDGKIEISGHKKEDKIIVSIKDYGVGIKEENLPYIFNKFYQGDISHASEGNGLGLALVKGIIDLIDAEIEVYSKENEGSEFIVKLKVFD